MNGGGKAQMVEKGHSKAEARQDLGGLSGVNYAARL